MRAIWQSWATADGTDVTFTTADRVDDLKASGAIPIDAELQYEFEAATAEEASAIHSLRQGFGPYTPAGDCEPCPKCAAWYYPEGSGECWRCAQS